MRRILAPRCLPWISKVEAESRRYEKVTQLDPGHVSHRFPQFVDDSHFLYYVTGRPEVRGIWVYDIANHMKPVMF